MVFVNNISDEDFSKLVTEIYMDDEKHVLSGWLEKKQVFVKMKDSPKALDELVKETLFGYREILILKLVEDICKNINQTDDNINDVLSDINDYNELRRNISTFLGRRRVNNINSKN